MKNFFRNLGKKISMWLYGRYGMDELSRTLSLASMIFACISLFWWPFFLPALLFMGWSLFRTYSKNIYARQKERFAYLRLERGIKDFFKLQRNKLRDRKTHRYYKCPKCRAQLRVPKGKGKITITCPKCGEKLNKKS